MAKSKKKNLNLNQIYISPVKIGKKSFILEFPLETLKYLDIKDKKVFWRPSFKSILLTKEQKNLEIPPIVSVDEFENQ